MIYLVRHGQAAASWGEHPDPGLSDLGRTQATHAAEILNDKAIEHVYTSPMARCQETAAAFVLASNLQAVIEPRVTEIPTPSDVTDRVPWLRALMGGEWASAPQLVTDWRDALIKAVSELPAQSVVFTHFVAINAIVGALENTAAVTVFRPNYCSITRLENRDGDLSLVARGESLETKVL